jgi:hypothetical protein
MHFCIHQDLSPLVPVSMAMVSLAIRMRPTRERLVRFCVVVRLTLTKPVFATVSMYFNAAYRRLSRPMPSNTHSNYPMYTPGGGDQRWHPDAILGEGMQCVGGLMCVKYTPLLIFR